jgi:hypothetical protein
MSERESTSASDDDDESSSDSDSTSYSSSESNDEGDSQESDVAPASNRAEKQRTASPAPARVISGMGRGCGPMPNREDMEGNMMVVCVQAAKESDLLGLAKDVRSMASSLIIGTFHDIEKCEMVACQLLRQQKVRNGEGQQLEQEFDVVNKYSCTERPGQRWPVLLAARKSAIKQIRIDTIVSTPHCGAVFVFQVDFKNMVCGQSHMRLAIHHESYRDYMCYQMYTWAGIAWTLENSSVRLLAGHLYQPPHDPLIATLKEYCPVHTVWFEPTNSSPVCFLGDIGKFTGTLSHVMRDRRQGKTNTMAFIPEVKGKTPLVSIPGVSKSFFGFHGKRCIRSNAALKGRQASRNEKRQTKTKQVNPDDI